METKTKVVIYELIADFGFGIGTRTVTKTEKYLTTDSLRVLLQFVF
ncbi:hypothetical protein LEP1GSC202_2392 [Leptospira yanagawae serovar Saopaulo str. Sao Paulo = ATCC 700523]|uniref:Uncharacterized protein n=1 Tax=Leptospira yanagawae serovar Saopaulo str. Sao Paulo = ATCC 700523 TaxID=1249483 RepID=A0A5E8HA75_9LEPT|nr:hypothetical protein LEP1GSC202_2392 [Leptospira yanagawae serovar Saopaulo str. Sao Paulo = ATCC 700523]